MSDQKVGDLSIDGGVSDTRSRKGLRNTYLVVTMLRAESEGLC